MEVFGPLWCPSNLPSTGIATGDHILNPSWVKPALENTVSAPYLQRLFWDLALCAWKSSLDRRVLLSEYTLGVYYRNGDGSKAPQWGTLCWNKAWGSQIIESQIAKTKTCLREAGTGPHIMKNANFNICWHMVSTLLDLWTSSLKTEVVQWQLPSQIWPTDRF